MVQERNIEDQNMNQEEPVQLHASKTADNSISQHSEQSSGKSLENPNDTQDRVHLDIHMPDQNPESLEEKDMKDTIPKGLDLIVLEDACTRKAFKSIPPKQIQLLHKALVKSKEQIGVATSGQKEKQKEHKDPKKRT